MLIDNDSIKRDLELTREIQVLTDHITKLKAQRKKLMDEQRNLRGKKGKSRNEIHLYALRLEGGHWYIGASPSPVRRYKKHLLGKGANWTRLHKPVELVETRPTGEYYLDKTSLLEDDMTLEYALKYGSQYVRGGGYCQTKPKWPLLIIENETYSWT